MVTATNMKKSLREYFEVLLNVVHLGTDNLNEKFVMNGKVKREEAVEALDKMKCG